MAGILEGSEDSAVDKGAEVPVLKGFMAWGSDNKNIHRHKQNVRQSLSAKEKTIK